MTRTDGLAIKLKITKLLSVVTYPVVLNFAPVTLTLTVCAALAKVGLYTQSLELKQMRLHAVTPTVAAATSPADYYQGIQFFGYRQAISHWLVSPATFP